MEFIKCVNGLQKAMNALVSENSTSEKLVRAQNLMQIAMKRLQKEFYQTLSMSRAHLDMILEVIPETTLDSAIISAPESSSLGDVFGVS
jgi:hypothetical protein